ncbi:DUF4347 domain-containing protein [Neptunomonas japonica]|uniref:Cadherin domain-containing protein n=1 Tax=Neptunomonas japonica JAMM 1380 TaxID=1441457 RepID=A0A7R6P9J8_9GAMM|nr:DUF4347 domain-containing protein [Neptunomonas japonica]BBB28359.1 hypothetical protein NEJAP_0401 [Neptunomonas japonica JAMM 1380]
MNKSAFKRKQGYKAPVIEGLEPRILLSADVPGLDVLTNTSIAEIDDAISNILRDAEAEVARINVQPSQLESESTNHSVLEPEKLLPITATQETSIRHEIVFINSNVPDYERLLEDIKRQTEDARNISVLVLNSHINGVEHITEVLANYTNLDAIHILSHSSDGTIDLGSAQLSNNSLPEYQNQLRQWGESLNTQADILIYGCNLVSSGNGQTLIEQLSELTLADIAASDDLTGHAELGGDWELEYSTGNIETNIVIPSYTQADWQVTLDITSSLVAHYTFDEGSGSTAFDSSASANNASLIGSPVYSTGIVGSGALNFSGDFDYVDAPDAVATDFGSGDFSVGFWFNSTSLGTAARLVGDSIGADGYILYGSGSGEVNFLITSGAQLQTLTAGGLFDGEWHHVVGTRSGNDFSLYIDNTLADSATNALIGSVDNTVALRMGATDGVSSDYDGLLDEVRLYNRALTSSDITELYNNVGNIPVIISSGGNDTANISVIDGTTSVATVSAIDNNSGTMTYSISGGDDALKFSINPTTGVLTFASAPEFSSPTDTNLDNVYKVIVQASDGIDGSDTQAIDVMVTDSTYPTSYGANNTFEWITNVTFAGINNTTGQDGGGYGDYTAQFASVAAGTSNDLSITINAYSDEYINTWIDWNQDGDFLDINESYTLATNVMANGPYTLSILAPTDAVAGTTVMRTSVKYQDAPASNEIIGFGEVEDYSITVTSAVTSLTVDTATNDNDSGITNGNASQDTAWLNLNKGGDAAISLREAIIAANNTSGTDTINFNIAGSGIHTISLTSALPAITEAVIINGTTETDFSGAPLIAIDGSSAGVVNGLWLQEGSDGSTIRGLQILNAGNDGIKIDSSNNLIAGNYIGTDGIADLGSTYDGIRISGSNNIIGGTTASDRNVIAGNNDDGIQLQSTATGTVIAGNYIGVNASGLGSIGNGSAGIELSGTTQTTTIGGTVANSGNIIGGNQNGIVSYGSDNNTISGNYIGIGSDGLTDIGNSIDGIRLESGSTNNVIGGTTTNERNIISGNNDNGIFITGTGTTNNTVQGNFIGTDITGTISVGNTAAGIEISSNADANTIGGTTVAARNIISGNSDGIYIQNADGTIIKGNYIGTDVTGLLDLGNSDRGIQIESGADNTIIGGTTSAARNVISGNNSDGIIISDGASPGTGTTGTVIQGNYIGVGSDSTTAISNGTNGIRITTESNHTIGGTEAGAGNIIAFNAGDGILLSDNAATDNTILGNSIHSNTQQGIDLGNDGVTANDLVDGDGDTGANSLQNFPVLFAASVSGVNTTITGQINSNPNTTYRIEFFSSPVGTEDPSGHGEGETYLGYISVTTDINGDASINAVFGVSIAANDRVSSTATVDLGSGNYGATSEFSMNVITTSPSVFTQTLPGAQSIGENQTLTFNATNGNAVSVSDTNGTTDTRLQVFISVNDGILTLSQTTGLSILGGANASSFMTVHGSESDLNAALEGMTFTPDTSFSGAVSLQMTTSLGADMTGYYSFDAGNAIDDSVGVSQNGVLINNASSVTDATRGEVLSLDGDRDYVQIASMFGDPANVTLAAWVNYSSFDINGGEVITLGGDIALRVDDGSKGVTGFFYDGSSYQFIESNISLSDGNWHHIAFSFDDVSNTQKLYIDGAVVGSATLTSSITYTGWFGESRIGAHPNDGDANFDFNGLIDDARIYTRALSSDEIFNLAADNTEVSNNVAITVTAANNAPTVGGGSLPGITEDLTNPAGETISNLFSGSFNDVDAGSSMSGVLITNNPENASQGTWQYSTDTGSNWYNIGNIAYPNSLALDTSTSIRFVPSTDYNGSPDVLSLRALDNTYSGGFTSGATAATADASSPGGSSSISSSLVSISTVVTAVNDAPEMPTVAGMFLTAITEDNVNNGGNLVSEIIASNGGNSITDADAGALEGIAITSIDNSNGTWQYNIGGGWLDVDTVSFYQSLLLRDSDSLRFVPDQKNSDIAFITFSAWDQTSGTTGTKVDTSTFDTSGAFSFALNTASISITGINDAPTGTTLVVAALEETATAIDISSHVADVDGTVVLSTTTVTVGPSNGSLTNNSDGTFSYTGNLNFVGADSFTYTVEDNDGQLSSDITVTINVSDVNDAPAGTNKTVATLEDTDFVFAASDFGFTDSSDSPANNLLNIIITSAPINGDLFLDSNGDGIIDGGETLINLDSIAITDINAGKLKFKPALNGNGSSYDAFTFQVQDDGGTANSGVDTDPSTNTITIDVTPQNDPATIGGNTSGSAAEGVVVTGTLTASDADGLTDGSYFSISGTAASNGTPSIDASSGAWTYTPSDANWFGSDSFEVTVTDDAGGTTTQAVSITITNTDDPATIGGNTSGSAAEGVVVTGTLTASDADGLTDGSYFSISGTAASNGTPSIDASSGAWTYTPSDANWFGSDSFEVTVTDDAGGTTTQAVSITITNTDDPASIGGNTSGSAAEGVVVTGTLTATDADGLTDGSYFSISGTAASNGTPSIDASSGAWTYTPSDANWFGSDSFEVTVTDDAGGSTAQTISITLSNINDPAVIDGDNTGTVTKNLDVNLLLSTSGTLSITDVDPGQSSFLPASITGNYGIISINTTGAWSYSADNSQATIQVLSGSQSLLDTFTVMSADGTTHNIAITINGIDSPPSVIIPITPEPEQPTTPPTEEPDDENTSEIEETNDTNETNDTENATETIFDDSSSLTPAFITATATPTPLTPNDLFLSVLSERPSTIKTTEDTKPSVEITQTFLQELASFWKDDGIATVEPSDSSTKSLEFLDDLDKMLQDLDESEMAKEKELELSAEAITGVSITLTAGFVSWALRAGSLMASLLAAMPAWRHLDPMPILAANEKDQKEPLQTEQILDNIQDEKTENKVDELFER